MPVLELDAQRAASGGGKSVVAGAPVVVGRVPVAGHETILLEALQGRVERTLVHLQHALGDLLHALADPPSVHGGKGERLQDQQVERAPQGVRLWPWRHVSSGLVSVAIDRTAYQRVPVDVKRNGTGQREVSTGTRSASAPTAANYSGSPSGRTSSGRYVVVGMDTGVRRPQVGYAHEAEAPTDQMGGGPGGPPRPAATAETASQSARTTCHRDSTFNRAKICSA